MSSQSRAPAANCDIRGRGIRINLNAGTTWHKALLVDWSKGTIRPGEPHAGELSKDHGWALCEMCEDFDELEVQLLDKTYGQQWAWEEDERFIDGFDDRQQERFNRSEFETPSVAYTLWRRLKQLQQFWAHGVFNLEDITSNHCKFADTWPMLIRGVLKDLLRDHFL